MDEVWPWLASLLRPTGGNADAAPPPSWSFPIAASPDGACVVLQANVAAASANGDDPTRVVFSLAIHGANGAARTLWTSEGFAASSPVALRVQLLVQLLDEAIALSPSVPCLGAHAVDLAAEVVIGVAGGTGNDDVSAPAAAAAFFSLALLLRLFWCCALDAPADSGFLFFRVLGAEIEHALAESQSALGAFLRAVGPDVEERFVRSLGYMLAKWCLLREIQSSSELDKPSPRRLIALPAVSYAAEAHGLWVLRGYAPVLAMPRFAAHDAHEEPALRYGLAHQQLEAVVQLEYVVRVRDSRSLTVSVRVDNARLRVARLGFRNDDDYEEVMDGERHFPSRLRVWVGPRYGASYATGPSLGRSTGNPEREVETTRVVKGAFFSGSGTAKPANNARVKAKVRSSARTRVRSWRWEQEAEGGAAVFEGVLCDPATGAEVAAWRPPPPGAGAGSATGGDPRNGMRRRYAGPGRAFSKMGRGVVVAGDEVPEEVTWRVGREAEGRTLRWRLGLKAWLTYMPNEVRSRHFETRCVEWAHEVDLPLQPVNGDHS